MPLLDSTLSCEVDIAQRLIDIVAATEGMAKLTGLSDPALIAERHILLCTNEPPYRPEGYLKDQLQQERILCFIEPPDAEVGHSVIHPAGTREEWDENGQLFVTFRWTPADYQVQNEEAKQTTFLTFWDCTSSIARKVMPDCWTERVSGLNFHRIQRPSWVAVEDETTRGLELTCMYQFEWGVIDAGE